MAGLRNFKTYIWAVSGACILYICFSLFQGFLTGEKGRIKKFILQGKRVVEARDILSCVNLISAAYSDKYGNDRQSLLYSTKIFFDYYKRILVNIESTEIKLNDAKTQAEVEIVALVIGQNQQSAPEKILEGEKGRFRIKLIKEEKKWALQELEFFEEVQIMGQNIS